MFVSDTELRDSLRFDIAEAEGALLDGQWKSATVLGSSVIEALLLWVLTDRFQAEQRTQAITTLRDKGYYNSSRQVTLRNGDHIR